MNPGIFLIQPNGELVEMNEQSYDSETILQKLLADYPSLLAGHQIDPDEPRRWLLIKRECGVPSEEGGSSRWSTDHLFLDQDAVPTIVETKIKDNTDLRRKVVGQMLDYAANAVVYWPVSYMRERLALTCEERGLDTDEQLAQFLDPDADSNEFWATADRNLREGKIRLLFVADEIPTELQRIVEFLNEQMDQTEVLAIEIKQFVGRGQTGLVPRVIGRTAEAQLKKSGVQSAAPVTVEEVIAAIREKSVKEAEIAQRILDWSKQYLTPKCNQASFLLKLKDAPKTFHPLSVDNTGRLWIYNKNIRRTPPFDVVENWTEFRKRLDDISGVDFPENEMYSSAKLLSLADDTALTRFLDVIAWSIEQVKKSAHDR